MTAWELAPARQDLETRAKQLGPALRAQLDHQLTEGQLVDDRADLANPNLIKLADQVAGDRPSEPAWRAAHAGSQLGLTICRNLVDELPLDGIIANSSTDKLSARELTWSSQLYLQDRPALGRIIGHFAHLISPQPRYQRLANTAAGDVCRRIEYDPPEFLNDSATSRQPNPSYFTS